jgi:hypothetical protein
VPACSRFAPRKNRRSSAGAAGRVGAWGDPQAGEQSVGQWGWPTADGESGGAGDRTASAAVFELTGDAALKGRVAGTSLVRSGALSGV